MKPEVACPRRRIQSGAVPAMSDRGHIYRAGEDPLAPWPMTVEQVTALVEHVRENQDDGRARSARARWAPPAFRR